MASPTRKESPRARSGLTDCQQRAYNRLAPIFRGEEPGARVSFTGCAGTGKTFLEAQLVDLATARVTFRYPDPPAPGSGWEAEPPQMLLLAPTHKACRQIEKALAEYGLDDIEARTLHSALGLRVKRDGAQQSFFPDPTARKLIGPGTRLVVVDEASMVGIELTQLLLESLPKDAALVAIGDPAQLQPVGEPNPSELLSLPEHVHLSEVVRYSGPILQLATETRELGTGRARYRAARDERSVIATHPSFAAWYHAALQSCHVAALEEDFDAARMLAWTNRAVDKFNRELHHKIYGADAPLFVAGMPIVSRDAIPDPTGLGAPLVSSTCEMVIVSADRDSGMVVGDDLPGIRSAVLGEIDAMAGAEMPFWNWWLIHAVIAGTNTSVRFKVLDPSSFEPWGRAARGVASAARKDSGLWSLYWQRRDAFGDVNPIWGLTIHKSQGSTFRRVFLHPEIDRHPDRVEGNRLAYVGMTRPQQELHILTDDWGW